jgi:hypothetical protein
MELLEVEETSQWQVKTVTHHKRPQIRRLNPSLLALRIELLLHREKDSEAMTMASKRVNSRNRGLCASKLRYRLVPITRLPSTVPKFRNRICLFKID